VLDPYLRELLNQKKLLREQILPPVVAEWWQMENQEIKNLMLELLTVPSSTAATPTSEPSSMPPDPST